MKVFFNVEAVLARPMTGVGHYARNILLGLLDPAAGLDVTCFADRRPVPPPLDDAEPGPAPPPAELGLLKRLAIRVPGVTRLRDVVRDAQVNRRFANLSGAVYHDPNHVLQPLRCRKVVTLHDLSVLHHPEMHPAERVRSMGGRIAASARQADLIITGTDFIKRDIVATLGVAPDKIRVVPHGVGAEFRPLTPGETAPVLARHGLRPQGYVLVLGTREPRKNLERLLDAYMQLPLALRAERPIALVGPAGWRAERLEARLSQMEAEGMVKRLGYVPDAERVALYSGAACFAYPSLYEGFGLPPLEAAACGAPVLTSAASSMSEVMGAAATLVDALDVDAIEAGLRHLLSSPDVAGAALIAGPALAARYTWAASVAGTIAAYRDVMVD